MTLYEVTHMNKYLFEDWLRNRLADLPPEELERVAGMTAPAAGAGCRS